MLSPFGGDVPFNPEGRTIPPSVRLTSKGRRIDTVAVGKLSPGVVACVAHGAGSCPPAGGELASLAQARDRIPATRTFRQCAAADASLGGRSSP